MDEGTKMSLILSMKRKISKLTSEDKNKEELKDELWTQLRKNEYG